MVGNYIKCELIGGWPRQLKMGEHGSVKYVSGKCVSSN